MATTVIQSFDDFAANLELPERQVSLVAKRRRLVVDALSAKLTLHSSSPSLVTGSYDRNTMTRFLSEGDVDLMVVLRYRNHSDWHCSEGAVSALDAFRRILHTSFPEVEKRRDRNCITMKYKEFRLDVVPAFSMVGGYYIIPDSVRSKWVSTDPIRFQQAITDVNKSMGQRFIPFIKMVKAWNRNVGWPIRSFHLECLLHQQCRSLDYPHSYDFLSKWFFEYLPFYLSIPTFDPVMGDRVDTYLDDLTGRTRGKAIELARKAAADSAEAYEDQTLYPSAKCIAIREWKALFGYFFPAYG